jgi:1-acyl-sn-glycerol-3-phosphate acyltransferase
VTRRRLGFWRRFAVSTMKPPLFVITKRSWSGMQNIPAAGGVIIAVNHHSEFDPLVVAHYIYDAGRWPQFLGKASLFRLPVLGPLLRAVRQIPVHRGTVDAVKALDAAAEAIRDGAAVVIYPEGTTPKQGGLWPMRGRTGIARLVLATGAPVVPLVAWGAQQLYDPRTRKLRLKLRTPVSVTAEPPIDLSHWVGATPNAANLYALTDEIMVVLRTMLAQMRGEDPPQPAVRSAAAADVDRAPGDTAPGDAVTPDESTVDGHT